MVQNGPIMNQNKIKTRTKINQIVPKMDQRTRTKINPIVPKIDKKNGPKYTNNEPEQDQNTNKN